MPNDETVVLICDSDSSNVVNEIERPVWSTSGGRRTLQL